MRIIHCQHQCVVKQSQYHYLRPEGLDEYVLVLAFDPVIFHADDKKYLLAQYQMFIYDKNTPQHFYAAGTGEYFCHDWFHFDMEENDLAYFLSLGISFGKPITVTNPFELSALIRTIAIENSSNEPHKLEIIDMYMRCFFMKLSDMVHRSPVSMSEHPLYQCLTSLRSEIRSFPYRKWTLDMICNDIHLSKSWFQHNYREIFGITFQADLIQNRIEYAQNLLLRTDYTVEYISHICGYNSDVHFMRQFKKMTDFTPTAFRNKFKS